MSLDVVLGLLVVLILAVSAAIFFIFMQRRRKALWEDLPPGTRFDNYIVTRYLKRGGMAAIYLAFDVKEGTNVALKIMHESLLDDRDLIQKFLREGDILESLNRKHADAPIVRVFRHSREDNARDGRPFIALEYLEGVDLEGLLRAGRRFTQQETMQIVWELCRAIAAAHGESTWHRDVSPGNVMMRMRGDTVEGLTLIDFGVAKHEYLSAHTPDGSIHGKPPYMSPEQCRGQQIDGRSDIYALGILFYMLLKGEPPFTSKNPLAIMRMHEQSPVPPLPESIAPEVRSIVDRMLVKDRELRLQDMESVMSELERAMQALNVLPLAGGAAAQPVTEIERTGPTEMIPVWARISTPRMLAAIAAAFLMCVIVIAVLLWPDSRRNMTGDRVIDSSTNPEIPLWLLSDLSNDFYAEVSLSAPASAGYSGIAFGSAGSGDYYSVILSQNLCLCERIEGTRSTRMFARTFSAPAPGKGSTIAMHYASGKIYVYVNSTGHFPVVFAGSGTKRIGLIQGQGMKVHYIFNIKQD